MRRRRSRSGRSGQRPSGLDEHAHGSQRQEYEQEQGLEQKSTSNRNTYSASSEEPGYDSAAAADESMEIPFPLTPVTPCALPVSASPLAAVSFAASGWLKLYYFGVAAFLQDMGLDRNCETVFIGSSAGALTAAGLVLGVDFRAVRDFALHCVDDTHGKVCKAFRLKSMITACMDKLLKTKPGEKQPHQRLNGRLHVSVTALPWCQNRRYSEFDSYNDFRNALLASCCMTPIAGWPFKYRGEWVFDGGLSDFQPKVDDETITVSPFFFAYADIKPSRYVPLWWALYPPRSSDFAWLFDLGYHDAEKWSRKRWGDALRKDSLSGNKVQGGSGKGRASTPFFRPHDMSFGRFFGYRSICKVIPSWILTMMLFLMFFVIVRPLFAMLVYVELFLRALVNYVRSCFLSTESQQHNGDLALCRAHRCLCLFFSPVLMLRVILVPIRRWMELDRDALCRESFFFRVAVHFI